MGYFETVVTLGNFPYVEATASLHKEKLNNFEEYGIARETTFLNGLRPEFKPKRLGGLLETKERKILHMTGNTFMQGNNQQYVFVTVLCSEEEEPEE